MKILDFHPIIAACLDAGIEVTMVKPQTSDRWFDGIGFKIDGFYKSGSMLLLERGGELSAVDRYEKVTTIKSIEDLVDLNYECWRSSSLRHDSPLEPSPIWLGLLIKHGFIKAKTVTVYEPAR